MCGWVGRGGGGGGGGGGGLLHYTFPVMFAFPFYLSLLSVFLRLLHWVNVAVILD